jgi:very-short-patch-repair endonuclease
MRDYTPSRLERARSLRRTDADAEMRLWHALRSRRLTGWKFRRQHPVGPFVVDFACLAASIVIEVDGAHHAEQRVKDEARTRLIEPKGFRVVRFDDGQVLNALDAVLEVIRLALEDARPAEPTSAPHPVPAVDGERKHTSTVAREGETMPKEEPSPRPRGFGWTSNSACALFDACQIGATPARGGEGRVRGRDGVRGNPPESKP